MITAYALKILVMAGATGTTCGVDSVAESSEALQMGKLFALDMGTMAAISGKVDCLRLHPTSTFARHRQVAHMLWVLLCTAENYMRS